MSASFSEFDSAGGAKIFRLPLQVFPDFWAYAYIVRRERSVILIDAGSSLETSRQDLLRGFERAGVAPSDLTHILLTHGHIDHYGGLAALKPLTGAKVGCHELDLQMVTRHEAWLALASRRFTSFLAETGLAADATDALLNMYRFTKKMHQPTFIDFTYDDIHAYLPNVELIHTPGHCPGHVALRFDDVVFCGDMILENATPHLHPSTTGVYGGLSQYLASLEAFRAWADDARLILNGHDEAIANLPDRIDATHRNILRRMSKALRALTQPLTISEICSAIYGALEGYNALLVIEKTGAYVEYLYERGMIEIVNADEVEQGGPARYWRARDESETLEELQRVVSAKTHIQEAA
ncbi:MAG: MBL fold metallo-hydrolase [Anaerolineales bacterium]|nr:MBL fold metallo-hydrolase [Anaerolineales bacterium]